MRNTFTALILTGGLVLSPFAAFGAPAAAQAQSAAKDAKGAAKGAKAAKSEHVTTGTVKSVDATTMVVTRSGKKHTEMTFDLPPSVHREGTVAVGAHVSIRYHEEGNKHVATAITVRRPA